MSSRKTRKWQHKKDPVQGIHIDTDLRILWYDPKRYFVRFEGVNGRILHCYFKNETEISAK